MNILIKNVLHQGQRTDIAIRGNRIAEIGPQIDMKADKMIDGRDMAVIPGFVNLHTHAAMALFRGFGDDMPLMPWLEQKIWPNEAKLTPEDIYWGSKLACLEMIKSGTTAFLDMYYKPRVTAQAVEEMGLRAVLSVTCIDHFYPDAAAVSKQKIQHIFAKDYGFSDRIKLCIGPHAIYTVSGDLLQWIGAFSKEHDLQIHIHLSETETENKNSIRDNGLSAVRYLKKLGLLSPRLIIAHAIYVDDDELQMLADYGVNVAHNPASNMKLASGFRFKFDEMRQMGIPVGIGTDGCASSNNLDMVEAMKIASLLGKVWRKDPQATSATAVFEAATKTGSQILRINAGEIKVGNLADLSLIDLHSTVFTPNFNFISNLVYAANGNCVDTVICDGKVLMEHRHVEGEDEILEQSAKSAYNLVNR